MAIVAVAFATGSEHVVLGVGIWPVLLAALVVFAFRISSRYDKHAPWRTDRSVDPDEFTRIYGMPSLGRSRLEGWRLRSLIGTLLALAAIVLVAGVTLSYTADALATQTGLGAGLTGLLLLALATSLPEITTVTFAVRMRRFELAIGDVLGANIFNLAILLFADIAFEGPAIFSTAGPFEIAAVTLSLTLTGILVIGLLEQRNRRFLSLGIDSWAILIVYIGGVALLHGSF
jgi:cation:H+ antiporter